MTEHSTSLLLSYHNDPAIKAKYLARVRSHREADRLVQGISWRDGKGCAVGCTLEAYEHARYPIELGIPGAWAHFEDTIFEHLPHGEAMLWPEAFLDAIPVGVDLWPAYHRVTARILREITAPNVPAAEPEESRARILAAIETCARLYDEAAAGRITSPTQAYWTAYSAAWSTARTASAAESEPDIEAERAARIAARSAASSTASIAAEIAGWSAESIAAGDAANSAVWKRISEIALEELRRLPA